MQTNKNLLVNNMNDSIASTQIRFDNAGHVRPRILSTLLEDTTTAAADSTAIIATGHLQTMGALQIFRK